MSDEFEAISVETESPVAGGSGAEAPVATESFGPEPVGTEIEATQVNLDPADDALKQNSQQAYLENNAPDRAGNGPAVTLAGIAAREAEKEEKKAEASEHFAEQEKQADRRREWMEREHEFGGVKMSGHDLSKFIDFISDPKVQEKLRERLGKSGMSKDKVDKTMKDLDEYSKLIKKAESGEQLSEEDKRRIEELKKDKNVQQVIQQALALADASKLGINVKSVQEKAAVTANIGANAGGEYASQVAERVAAQQNQVTPQAQTTAVTSWSATDPKEAFPDTSAIKSYYNDMSRGQPVAANAPEPASKPQVAATTQLAAVSNSKIEMGNNALM